jgi:hypothetical protein
VHHGGVPAKLPIEHLVRSAAFPWRSTDDAVTECGRPAAAMQVITRDEFVAKVRKLGEQRAAFTTCMTCWHTASRYKTWGEDPVDAVHREVMGGFAYRDVFRRELWAIAALISAHEDEFREYLHDLDQTVSLSERRRARRGR